ncbi:unnamed protein product [Orchesella dallaii]|uniref:BTB domain-containing protein n=1 Tax=Orchesella dallaii TaxID=48710 RepID=A0ABP1RPK5_9HEXA
MKLTLLDTNQLFMRKEVAALQQYDFTYSLMKYPLELAVVPLKSNEGTESKRNFMSEIRNKLVVSPSSAPVGSDLSKKPTIGFMFYGSFLSVPEPQDNPPVGFESFGIVSWFSTAAFTLLEKDYKDKLKITLEVGFESNHKIRFDGYKLNPSTITNGGIPQYNAICIFQGPENLFENSKGEVRTSIKVEVELEDPIINLSPVPDHRVFNKDILLNQIQCDFKIIAEDDQMLQCHKAFLAAQSKVFTAMFNTACEETTKNQVKLPISREGADAFLKFLYCSDVEAALGSPTLAMDLLEFGHKYDISPLETKMKKILSDKTNWWYSADNALRLFDWNCKVKEHKDLKKKAVDVIRSKVKELMRLDRFQKMFPNHVGAELFISSLQSFPI